MRLKNKLSGSVVLLVAFVVFSIGIMTVGLEKALLTSEQKRHQNDLVTRLAKVYEESLLQNELLFFNYIKNLKSERGFLSAFFMDTKGRIQIHSDPTKIGQAAENSNFVEEKSSSEMPVIRRGHYMASDGQRILDVAAPAYYGSSEAGFVHILFDAGIIHEFIQKSVWKIVQRIAWISLIALIIGLLGAYWLARTIVSPIEQVVRGMQDVADGKLDPQPELKRKDELGWMTRELNLTIQKLKEVDEMKREFIASVTHEFRSPLTAIQSFLSLLIKGQYGPLTDQQKDSLLTIRNNTVRLTAFVDDLLTTAKLEAKKMDVVNLKFDLCDTVNEVAHLFSSLAKDHNLSLNTKLPDEPVFLYSDQTKISQILANLVSNAIKFTKTGSILVQVEKKSSEIELSVLDTGVGISDSEKSRIFEKFYRIQSTASSAKGTGLGLSIIKAYADLLGAKLVVTDNPAGGTRFSLTFPPAVPLR